MILGIDTSTASLGIALISGDAVTGSMAVHRPNMHDELLVPLMETLLGACGATTAGLRAVAVSAGPGSFTGLRIGMAAAKGIALSLGIPLLAVPSFDAVALAIARRAAGDREMTLCVAVDARRGDVYAAVYTVVDGAARAVLPLRVIAIEELPALLPEGTRLAGDAAGTLAALRADLVEFPRRTRTAAEEVALLGASMLAAGEAADVDSVEPLYLRDVYTSK